MNDTPSVLVVDDDEIICEFLATVLGELGYQTIPLPNGMSALKYLEQNPTPDLILLDVIMPEMTGIELLRKIKQNPQFNGVSIIMVTGISNITEKELAFMLGANDYIEKPFDTRELIARVKTHINLKKTTDAFILQTKIQDTILQTVPGVVFLKNSAGEYIHVNDQFSRFVGKLRKEIEGTTDIDLFSPRCAQEREKTDNLILNLGIPEIELQEEIETLNGETRVFLTRKKPVFDNNNIVNGLVGVSIDISDQITLKESYQEKAELLHAMVNAFPGEIWAINPDTEIILQNENHMISYGQLIGQKINEIAVSEKTRSDWIKWLEDACNGKTTFIEPKDSDRGNTGYCNDIITPIGGERILGAMGICFNNSPKEQNQELTEVQFDESVRDPSKREDVQGSNL